MDRMLYSDEFNYYFNDDGYDDVNDMNDAYESNSDDFDDAYVDSENETEIDGASPDWFPNGSEAEALDRKKFSEYDFKQIMEDYHSGDPARQERAKTDAIYAMEGVVRSIISKKYHTYMKKHYFDLDQSGKLGIIKALERFDANRGAASTFFYSYIVHEMQMYIDSFVNKTTSHYSASIRKIKKAIEVIKKKKGTYTSVDIAQETGLTMEAVEQALSILNSTEEVHYENCTDAFLKDNIDLSKHNSSPEDEMIRKEQEGSITEALEKLPILQQRVLVLSFGLEGSKELSYKEIAKRLDTPIDKVKKAYADGLKNLRKSNLKYVFKDYLEYDEIKSSQGEIAMTGIKDIFNAIADDVEFDGDFSDC